MKKRILSLVLATLMIISVLPAHALAENEPLAPTDATAEPTTAVSEQSRDGSVHVNKSISKDGTTLTLEAYLTNKVIQTVSTKPLDIVLVLDQSGSMAYDFNGNYTSKNDNRRQYAMKQAVNTFIGKVNEQYSDQGNHQMAIVTFAGNANQLIGWTAVDNNGKITLINAINGLPGNPPEGATNVGAGMQKAQELMNSAKNGTDRQKIVIVFTDGVPTTYSDFDTDVANAAIKTAKAMKDAGTIVYTVGIFNGANPAQLHGDAVVTRLYGNYPCTGAVGQIWGATEWGKNYAGNDFVSEEIPAGNRFLNYLSTNYKNATEIGIQSGSFKKTEVQGYEKGDHPTWLQKVQGYKITKNATRTATNYYLTARDADGLTGAFQTIIQENSTLEVKAGTSTILSDTLSPHFALNVPANTEAKDAITAEKWDCTGKNANGYTWEKAATQPILKVEVTEEKTIKVTGFDYTENAVTETTKEGKTTYSGSKLVVTIPIKPDTSCNNWQQGKHYYDTNKEASLSYGEKNSQKLELTESPQAPVAGYKVTYQVTSTENPDYTAVKDDTVYIKGQEAKVQAVPTTTSQEKDGQKGEWRFNGWYNGGTKADTTIEITDNVTLTGTWSFTAYEWRIVYQWATDTPSGAPTPPTDTTLYKDEAAAKAATTIEPSTKVFRDGHDTWTFDKWDNGTVKGTTLTYTGTWTSSHDNTYNVKYEYATQNLPKAVTDTLPATTTAYDKDEVHPTQPSETEVSVEGGKWTFEGWDAASKTVNGADVTFTGTWKFTSTEQPPEKTYDVSLTITKTVDNVHGTAPAETYEFVVYYYNTNNEKVYLCNASNPLTISLAKDKVFNYTTGTITVKDSTLNDWPLENDVRYVYVEEIKGGTEHMSYADQPIRGEFRKSEISFYSVPSETVYSFYCTEGRYGAFEFTNVYNKLTDRDVTPAKVSPQLNRDDHVAYIMGYPDGNVRPEGEITRAEACTIFFRLLTEESRDYYFSKTNDYTDVSRTDWFNNAISTLSNAGIVTGYADGTFRPDQPITRGEMAKIIANFARLGGATKSFTDLSGHWAKSYVELAAGNGWIAGYPDGTFGPDKKITRAETVTMINRVLERVPAKESRLLSRSIMLTFPDNEPGEWYYIAVQEASNSHAYQRSAYETAGDEMWIKLIENVDWTKLEK